MSETGNSERRMAKTLAIHIEGEEDPMGLQAPGSYAELLEAIGSQCSVDQAQIQLERRMGTGGAYILSDVSYFLALQHAVEPLTLHATILPKAAFLEGGYYAGELVDDLPHSYGNMYYHNSDCYRGEWVEGVFQGPGCLMRKSPYMLIEGEFYQGKPDGHAVEQTSNGTTYTGNFVAGVKEGRGKTIYPDGAVFQGTYHDDNLVGRGTMTLADGTVYEGDLSDHMPTGLGKIKYTDGTTYEGEVRKGLRHGKGVLRHKDGWVLEGRFEGNAVMGEGVLTAVDGKKTVGRWENDVLVEVEAGVGPIHYRLSMIK